MNRIKELRENQKLNQEDLAKVVGCSRSLISKYENRTILLTDDTIRILATYFDVSTDYLLGRSDIKKAATPLEQPLTPEEMSLLEETRGLTKEDKEKVIEYISLLRLKQKP